ncbi:Ger(x)C family spore germination protein [Paenibacillus sp. SC116]|uniref:Ger(x)C family spore germination protein n=1 Tax=Paenibacillus sp. SC116 TaxID=2968986 RepID=UPI00215ACE4E|nr:Ger(x)C family spore germination protein [Paenibacillus sp. SC116]MCR8843889.1 Ger(x)C family spore germination protein [Paenibacillus sp. SC116]
MNQFRMKQVSVILVLVLLSGCFHSNVLERTSISVAVGYDKIGEGKIQTSSVLYGSTSKEGKESSHVISVEGETSKGARLKLNQKLGYKVVSGQIRFIAYEGELARDGILSIVDTLSRDPSYGDMMYLSVTEKPVRDILAYKYPNISNVGTYLGRLIAHNIQDSWVPSCTLHEFRNDFYSVGKEAALPIVERTGKEVNIKGLALFRRDIMVGKIEPEEAVYLKLLMNRENPESIEVKMQKDGMAKYVKNVHHPFETIKTAISNIGSKSSIKLVSQDNLQFDVHIRLNVELQEISEDYDFTEEGAVEQLETELGKQMSVDLLKMLNHLQRLKSDAVGFGEVYRSSVRNSRLTKDLWQDMFPKAKFNTSVSVNLIRTGTIE